MDSSMVFGVFRNLTSSTLDANSAEADMDSEDMDTMFSTSTTSAVLTTSTTAAPDTDPSVSMNNFYPALVQCFGIIICGYIAGRFKIISNSETKGLGTFVGTFALPSLIFLSLVELDWSTVNWTFLLAMTLSKSIVFFAVLVISLLITRPLNYARAGLLSIFCTQSNDFAIGYPIVMALYKDVHPEYASYLYLMAPISLALLNPIGLVLMEISKIIQTKAEAAQESTICPDTCPAEQLTKRTRCLGEKQLLVLHTLKSLFFNPMLLMTLLGVGGAFVFPNGLPEMIASVLRVFGQSFSATALFLLGLKIVGQGGSLRGAGFLLPGILILVKILVLPLVCRQTVNIMQAGTDFNDTTELSTFGFLYGTFPAAPGAFVIATQYNVEVELVATGMVLCTFISAPLMFISAKMISITNLNPVDYIHELDVFSFDISVAGVAAAAWVLVLLIVTKRFRRMPHRVTFCLVLSQLICCAAVIIWAKFDHAEKWLIYVQFFLFNMGTFSSRLWTAILAICLLFLQCRSLCFVLNMWPYMIAFAWGVPAIISGLLIALDSKILLPDKHNACFQYGTAQAAVTVFMLVMCFFVTVGCLVMHQRYKKRYEKYLTYTRELSNPDSEPSDLQSTISTANLLTNTDGARLSSGSVPAQRRRYGSYSSSDDDDIISTTDNGPNTIAGGCGGGGGGTCCTSTTSPTTTTVVVDIEDLLAKSAAEGARKRSHEPATTPSTDQFEDENLGIRSGICSPAFNCGAGSSRQNCQSIIERYHDQSRSGLEPLEYANDADEYQTLKHTVLLILLLCSMFVGLSVSIWTLVMDGMSGIYLELSFLDAFLNFGQSLVVLALFITDTSELLTPFVKIWRKLWYGANVLTLPLWTSLTPETKHICEQFRNHHLENCKKDIAKDRRWRIRVYRKVFYGTEFVDWLLEVGLAKDRLEAVHYARHLVDGRVLRHINNVYHFEDKQLLYNFCARL
ncbi:integral membrane protein GPR155 isoform X1 [Bactrocera neohumeralis]|uniref:integral membrane protein GPR155 isoform X1 n=1 Tax=Bactrocera neohumeralis TaxID=98809 RepID=UPI002165AD79|nr:integral membrane protein GPR155 isoform X1 [Bactrocera neohumeralis]XP_050337117.1 integral membrane protein GPR155 isoform X1 [Bactrocera neohumeralis]